jgi:hypothetical protein
VLWLTSSAVRLLLLQSSQNNVAGDGDSLGGELVTIHAHTVGTADCVTAVGSNIQVIVSPTDFEVTMVITFAACALMPVADNIMANRILMDIVFIFRWFLIVLLLIILFII